MALENKLGITDSAELAREEEKISKRKAIWLFESAHLIPCLLALSDVKKWYWAGGGLESCG